MKTTVVRRVSDGLLADIQQGPGLLEDTASRIQNSINQFGGGAGDWQALEVPENLWVNINPLARQFGTLTDGAITAISQSTPPFASLSNGTVQADGIATITLTVIIPGYAGPVKVTIAPPSGSSTTETLTAVAGVASDAISTDYEGLHSVVAETELQGVAFASFEGVA
jgi:hypothetical protein